MLPSYERLAWKGCLDLLRIDATQSTAMLQHLTKKDPISPEKLLLETNTFRRSTACSWPTSRATGRSGDMIWFKIAMQYIHLVTQ
jgi:hypothetical protein